MRQSVVSVKGVLWRVFLPMVVIIVGSLLSFTAFFVFRDRETIAIREEFNSEAINHSIALQKSIENKQNILKSIQHFYKGSERVERDEFSEFVEPFTENPAVEALAWAPRVRHDELKQFKSEAAKQGLKDFEVFEMDAQRNRTGVTKRDDHFPLFYVESKNPNQRLIGYDLASESDILCEIDLIADTHKASASRKLQLPGKTDEYGFLFLQGVYKKGMPLGSIEDRKENLEGVVVVYIKIKELTEAALRLISTRGVGVELFDMSAAEGEKFLYDYVPGKMADSGRGDKAEAPARDDLRYVEKFEVGDRTWMIECTPTAALVSLFRTGGPWAFLIVGHSLTAILAVFVVLILRRTAAVEKLVAIRTDELNAELEEHRLTEEALRGSEDQFRTLVGNMPGAVYRCGIEAPWKMEHVSDAIFEISGYSASDFMEGKVAIGELIVPADRLSLEQVVKQSTKNKTPFSLEYGIYHKDGSVRYVHDRGKAIYDDDGKAVFLDGVIIDVSDRRQIENERRRLSRAIEAKNKELQSIVYTASHDLKSPLVNIMGFGDELSFCCEDLKGLMGKEDRNEDDDRKIEALLGKAIPESLKFISAGSNKINSLIDGLLRVSRVGSVELEIKPLDMNDVIKEIIDTVSYEAKESGTEITYGDLPACLGDAARTNQVFSNLINNALKYLDPERKGRIRVSGAVEEGMSVYCVEDNGKGIDPEYQEKVFEIFHRLDPGDSVGGEGIGLTIVTRILDRQNGSIRLESERGKGCKFFVSLPRA